MTLTTPLRRTMRQFLHILFTDALTFIASLLLSSTVALEIRLLEQTFVLMGHQVSLNL